MSLQQRLATIQGILLPPTGSNNPKPKRSRDVVERRSTDADHESPPEQQEVPGGHEPRLKRQRRIAEAMALPGMRLDPALLAQRYTCSTQPAPLPSPSPHASSKTAGPSVEQQSSATKETVTDEGNEVSPQQSTLKSYCYEHRCVCS
jgi:hypothetical protein